MGRIAHMYKYKNTYKYLRCMRSLGKGELTKQFVDGVYLMGYDKYGVDIEKSGKDMLEAINIFYSAKQAYIIAEAYDTKHLCDEIAWDEAMDSADKYSVKFDIDNKNRAITYFFTDGSKAVFSGHEKKVTAVGVGEDLI